MHHVPYVLNILILLPVVTGLLRGSMAAFPGAPDAAVLRIMVASLWSGVMIMSALALIAPLLFWPLLVFQVVYKSVFVILWVWPALVRPDGAAIPWGPVGVFLFIIAVWPFFIAAAFQSGQS